MRAQRKIFHILADNGKSGTDFAYLPRENTKHHFDWKAPIFVTDKMDGTTAQATNEKIFKRIDKFKSGDPRKFIALEDERYSLVELSEKDSQNKWIFEAYNRYKERLKNLWFNWTVYFEVFGSRINARYPGYPHDIRVFDFTRDDEFVSFEQTIATAQHLRISLVGYTVRTFSGIHQVLEDLAEAQHSWSVLFPFELEGWVLRQNKEIAKIRKSDLSKIAEASGINQAVIGR